MAAIFCSIIEMVHRAVKRCVRKGRLERALKAGMSVGLDTKFVGDVYFGTEPYLISIGSSSLITDGVKFINHDGAVSVPHIAKGEKLSDVYGKWMIADRIQIGGNVFIGNNAVILYGSEVGDNVVIASGSVVKGQFPSNCVLGGVPAKILCSLDEFSSTIREREFLVGGGASFRREVILENVDR